MRLNFALWLEEEDQLEEQIFSAMDNESVSQSNFNKLLAQWVKQTNPSLAGVAFLPQSLMPDKKAQEEEERLRQQEREELFNASQTKSKEEVEALEAEIRARRNKRNVKVLRQNPKAFNTTYLSGQLTPTYAKISNERINTHGVSGLGLIVQPYTSHYLRSETLSKFDAIGIDNGLFGDAGKEAFTWDKYEKMIKVALAQEKREVLRRLMFFTVPDEPFKWKETLQKFAEHRNAVQTLRKMGAPVAICVQNGATPDNVPWEEIDVIFIGGDDAWKVGAAAQAITEDAQARGMQIHMGRINTHKRLEKASGWRVDTADGTYLMHEIGKTLHEIERSNPRRKNESWADYNARLKRILYGQHVAGDLDHDGYHLTEPEITDEFIRAMLDNQKNNRITRRYDAIADLANGQPIHRSELAAYDNYLPAVPDMYEDDDVVEFDDDGYVVMMNGKPVRNKQIFDLLNLKVPYRELPQGIPYSKTDWKVYQKYMNRYIKGMRDRGIMPH